MKRIATILLTLIAVSSVCKAQETVQYGDPYYLFNERHYFTQDSLFYAFLGDTAVPASFWGMSTWDEICSRDHFIGRDVLSRYATPSDVDSILIYGVAATFYGKDVKNYDYHVTLARRDGNIMIFIDSTWWIEGRDVVNNFKYSLTGGDGVYYEHIVPVYEFYFDEPIMVSDTFYVGYCYGGQGDYLRITTSFDSCTSYWIENAHQDLYDSDSLQSYVHHKNFWGGVFPIIQPNRHCTAPSRPRVTVYNSTNTVKVERPGDDSLQLNITRAGQPVDSGMFYAFTDSVISIVIPDTGHYEARLRRFCDRGFDYLASDWSAAAPILILNPLGVCGSDAVPMSFSPNPASSTVVLECSVEGGTITILDMLGHVVAEMPSSQRTIDVGGLPAGTYILRLTAPDLAPIARRLIITSHF